MTGDPVSVFLTATTVGRRTLAVRQRAAGRGCCNGFAINTFRFWAPQVRAGDVVRWPYASAARSLIHERDIAAVAARALTEHGHAGAKYVLTEPESRDRRSTSSALEGRLRSVIADLVLLDLRLRDLDGVKDDFENSRVSYDYSRSGVAPRSL